MKQVAATREEILAELAFSLQSEGLQLGRKKSPPGSTQTLGGWEPKTCHVCGERVLAKNGIFTRGLHSKPESRHHDCIPSNYDA